MIEAIKNIRRQVEADTEGKWSARSVLLKVEQALSSLTPSPVGELQPVSMSMFATKDDMLRHLLAERKQTAASLTSLSAEVARKDVEIERLREALTPSGTTKAAYWGEFHERIEVANPNYEDGDDGEPETIVQQVPVSWTTVKKIMAAISTRAALSAPKGGEHE